MFKQKRILALILCIGILIPIVGFPQDEEPQAKWRVRHNKVKWENLGDWIANEKKYSIPLSTELKKQGIVEGEKMIRIE
jgi:hypothetical protein